MVRSIIKDDKYSSRNSNGHLKNDIYVSWYDLYLVQTYHYDSMHSFECGSSILQSRHKMILKLFIDV